MSHPLEPTVFQYFLHSSYPQMLFLHFLSHSQCFHEFLIFLLEPIDLIVPGKMKTYRNNSEPKTDLFELIFLSDFSSLLNLKGVGKVHPFCRDCERMSCEESQKICLLLHIFPITDYRHTVAKFIILFSPNSNPNPK